MDAELQKEIAKFRAEVGALVSSLPIIQRTLVRPVAERFFRILETMAQGKREG